MKGCETSELDDLLAQNSRLQQRVRALEQERERGHEVMLLWRGIDRERGDVPCTRCGGSGVSAYGDSSTWRGGIGGQVITWDVCDQCWGSGRADRPWTNLRTLPR